VPESKRSDTPLAFELAKLEWLQGESPDPANEFLLGLRRNKIGGIPQPFRPRREAFK
jgi:hypothetical protein